MLEQLAGLDLDRIPLSRLRLPPDQSDSLGLAGVSSVGSLARLPLDALTPYPRAVDLLNRYLQRLRRQPEPARAVEHAPSGAILPLDQLVAARLARLPETRRRAVRLRYGLDGEPHSLPDVARVLGFSVGHISKLLTTSHRALLRAPLGDWIRPHTDAFQRFLADRGGLASLPELEAELPAQVQLGALPPLVVCRLLTSIQPGFRWHARLGLLVERDKPLDRVPLIRRMARWTALTSDRPLTPAEIVSILRPLELYPQACPEARDAFFLACIRTDPRAPTNR